jgi:hypothetical protein
LQKSKSLCMRKCARKSVCECVNTRRERNGVRQSKKRVREREREREIVSVCVCERERRERERVRKRNLSQLSLERAAVLTRLAQVGTVAGPPNFKSL